MITRREFMAAALVAPVFPLASAMAQGVKEKEQAKQADFLFVQTAKSMYSPKNVSLQEDQRYQNVRIIAVYDTNQIPALQR